MFIRKIVSKKIPLNEIHISANPEDQEVMESIFNRLEKTAVVTLMNLDNSRYEQVEVNRIETIHTSHDSSIVKLSGEKQLYSIDKRIKELEYFTSLGIFRMNNSTMINITKIKSFQAVSQARLEIETKTGYKYIVSRYYAKKIKEELLCSKN